MTMKKENNGNNKKSIRNGVLIAVIVAFVVQASNSVINYMQQPETNKSDIADMKNILDSYIPIVENNSKQICKITDLLKIVGELQKKNEERWEKQFILNGQLEAKVDMLVANRLDTN